MSSVTILRWARMHLLPYARASHAHPVIILPLGGVGGSAASHLKAGDSILLPAAARRRRCPPLLCAWRWWGGPPLKHDQAAAQKQDPKTNLC